MTIQVKLLTPKEWDEGIAKLAEEQRVVVPQQFHLAGIDSFVDSELPIVFVLESQLKKLQKTPFYNQIEFVNG